MSIAKKLLKIESIDEFVPLVRKLCGSESFGCEWIFRGKARRRGEWPLVPKAGRSGFFDPNAPAEQKWEILERHGYISPLDMAVFMKNPTIAAVLRQLMAEPAGRAN